MKTKIKRQLHIGDVIFEIFLVVFLVVFVFVTLYPLINTVVSTSFLLSLERMDRMAQLGDYTPEAYLSDLHNMIFSELEKGGKVSSYRRYLQTRFVTTALEVVKASPSLSSPSRALLMGELLNIQKKAAKVKGSDATAAHWQAIARQIAEPGK